jgi:hypothetical protein
VMHAVWIVVAIIAGLIVFAVLAMQTLGPA